MQRDKSTIGTDRLWAEGFVSSLMILASLQGGGRGNSILTLLLSCPLIFCRGSPLSKPDWKPKDMGAHDVIHAGQAPRSKCSGEDLEGISSTDWVCKSITQTNSGFAGMAEGMRNSREQPIVLPVW